MKKKRKIICAVLAAAVVAAFCAVLISNENSRYIVSEYTFVSDRVPDSFIGYKIAQISDLHDYSWDNLADSVREGHPDLILITGDLIGRDDTDITPAINTVRSLVDIAPIYYVPGNHEYESALYPELKNILGDAGVTILSDTSADITVGDDSIRLCGIRDPSFVAGPDAEHDEYQSASDMVLSHIINGDGRFTVLLAHRPEFYPLYSTYSIDLTFSGHAHGGGFCLPLIGALWAPGQGFLPAYTEGLHSDPESAIVISRGLGDSTAPFRVNCPYELVFVTLTQGDLDMR